MSSIFESLRRGKNDGWRFLVGAIITLAVMTLFGQIPLLLVILFQAQVGDYDDSAIEDALGKMDFAAVGIGNNLFLFLILLSFVLSFFTLWIVVRKLHHRPFASLVNAVSNVRWNRVFIGFGIWLVVSVLSSGVDYVLHPENYFFQWNPAGFFPLFLMVLFVLPFQTSFEELFFRGYLMQGLGKTQSTVLLPLVLSSIGFGLMHIFNPEVEAFGFYTMMTYYVGVGLLLGIITIMDQGLELALGVHAATNMFAASLVTYNDSALQTDALFRVDSVDMSEALPIFFAFAALFIIICARLFRWKGWSRLWEKIPNMDTLPFESFAPAEFDNSSNDLTNFYN